MACGSAEEEEEWKVVKSTKKHVDHPIFKKLCIASGEVNSLSNGQIKARLKEEGLLSRGEHHVIAQRLKNHLHRSIATAEGDYPAHAIQSTNPLNLDYLLVIDFEATCQDGCPKDWIYEIIEFPVLLLNVRTLKVEDTFHSYCKPVLEPKLTKFCKDLTHITQEQVDKSPTFPDVFKAFQQWLEVKELGSKYKFLLVTDSPWDIRSCLYPQCVLTSIPLPPYARGWIDMRKLFSKLYRLPKYNIGKMLEHLGMKGEHHVIAQRLKNHLHRSIATAEGDYPAHAIQSTNPLNLDYLLVIDFEATCQDGCPKDWIYEIIEFPVLLLNVRTLKVEDTFHSYCKPVLEPKLTEFCKDLTHITQEQVDKSPTFPDVFKAFQQWLEMKELGSKYKFLLVTDNLWDIRSCLYPQCVLTSIPLPPYARGWIDMRKLFSKLYRLPKYNIGKMLEHLGMKFVGQQHSGIDDAKNICRIVCQMIQDGCSLTINCTCDVPH